ncbi:MAG: glycosyl transferase family 2 [Frankiales bacterium]|jgi:glycosyltransferase involved in cell wall biosynthesis|nr:glycosyl transferase family 2 [Frankiales bacterium]
MDPRTTCIVIPAYNEAGVLTQVLEQVLEEFPFVVCVDDGSSDDTAARVAQTKAWLVQHPINLGQGAALQTGISYGLLDPTIRSFVTFDADGQHQVADVRRMLDRLDRGDVDIVFGSRFLDERTSMSRLKRLVLKLAVAYTNRTSGVQLSDAHNGLRVFDRRVAEALDIRQNGMAHASEIVSTVAQRGFRYAEEPVHVLYTEYSRSKGQSVLNSVNIVFDLVFR